jgi:hypothetical protein
MYLGLEKPGITGGEGSALLPSLLLGGVLNGDTSAGSEVISGARVARAVESPFCGLPASFGFPARLTGGGIGGTEVVGRSLLRGSAAGTAAGFEAKSGLESRAGVASRLDILKNLEPLVAETGGDGESKAVCESGREGRGECISESKDFGGDFGDWTMTFGGDLVRFGGDLDLAADRGGEKAIIEEGRGFGLLHGVRIVLARGVTEPAPLKFIRLGELRSMGSRDMSSDMRPFPLLSSDTASRSLGPGDRCCGVTGDCAGALLAFNRFSKRARRSDTGFYMLSSACLSPRLSCHLRWTSRPYCPLLRSP